jgi:acyl carrier protein
MNVASDRERLRVLFARFVTDEAELDAVFSGAPILETVSIDSLALVHMMAAIETEFGCRFDLSTIDRAFSDVDALLAELSGRPGPSG